MPLKPKYAKIRQAMVNKYGSERGNKIFPTWAQGHNINPISGMAEKTVSIEGKSFTFTTDQINSNIIETKGGKKYYITGYISTSDKDRVNDIVMPECLDDMVKQLLSKKIKIDVEHEALKGSPNIIPIGIIEEAYRDTKGIWVKVRLNSAVSRFDEVWNSIKDGFLDSFSITYKTKKFVERQTASGTEKLLYIVELVNVALTGIPANLAAKITDSFAKSLEDTTNSFNITESTMADETINKKEEDPQPLKTEETTKTTEVESSVQVVEGKDIEGAINGIKELEVSYKSLAEKIAEGGDFEVSMKSFIDGAIAKSLEPFTKRLDAVEAKMAEPVFKAKAGDSDKDTQAKDAEVTKMTSMLSQIQ